MSKGFLTIPGFQFSGISAGIKGGGRRDLALIVSEVPAVVVGGFTSNRVQAAPVQVSKKNIRSGLCSAVIVNSGNANACTGARGLRDAQAMVRATARLLKVPPQQVLVCSTGKIGIPLPIGKILRKIPEAVRRLSRDPLPCAEAILTTDRGRKVAKARGRIFGTPYRIVGLAKGAGMIAPQLSAGHALRPFDSAQGSGQATMLAFILTDAFVPRLTLQTLFAESVADTFNRITVDGDTSTNDTALILANGLAKNRPFALGTAECRQFAKNLQDVMESLARQMVADGEGATKCVRIEVRGMPTEGVAREVAWAVGNSPLVKTSFFGGDPNWGRVLAAAGRAGANFDPCQADIFYDGVCVARRGISTGPGNDRKAKEVMRKKEFTVRIEGHQGRGAFGIWTSDLTLDYVKLNACYRT